MSTLLGLLMAVGALLTVFVGATAFSLRSSDAAGNGLAEVFLAFSVIGLWLLIGVMLLLSASKPPRHQLNWGLINAVSLLLFAIAVAGQFGALQVLSGHRAEGVYRLFVQLAVIVTPAAALAHIAWRGLGAPVPVPMALRAVVLVVLVGSALPLWGIVSPRRAVRAPQPDPLASLAYPALLLPDLKSIIQADSAADLRAMHSTQFALATDDTFLIDSRFQIFVLRDLRLNKGASGPMIRGQGLEPVSFRLVEWEPDGTANAARAILLRVKQLSADPDRDAEIRRQLDGETTLEGMMRIIRGE